VAVCFCLASFWQNRRLVVATNDSGRTDERRPSYEFDRLGLGFDLGRLGFASINRGWEGAFSGDDEDTSLPWKDMDLSKGATCGVFKCFLRSISNHSRGYLVAGEEIYEGMYHAWQLANQIRDEFGAKHFYLDVSKVNATRAILDRLNAVVEQPLSRVVKDWETNRQLLHLTPANATMGKMTVQTVHAAPKPSLFLSAANDNYKVSLSQVDAFRPHISDKDAFRRQLTSEFVRIDKILHTYPQLCFDFQGLIDTQGRFYHMDMDGYYNQNRRQDKRFIDGMVQKRVDKMKHVMELLLAD
jgi:hypothetical protein